VPPRRKREWFDDDSLWREVYPLLFSETRAASVARDAGRLLRLTRPRGKDVLDLCCGPGLYSIPLAVRGYRVTGVDRTGYYLAKARARARAAGARVEWVRRDMRDFIRPGAFDLALNMEASFGYFDDRNDDLRVLRHVLESLRPGGALVMEMIGKEQLAHIFASVTFQTLPNGTRLFSRHAITDDWTRIRNEWTFVRRGRAREFTFQHRIYSGRELRDLMRQAGFVGVKVYGDFGGEEYGPRTTRLVAVGRRPAEARDGMRTNARARGRRKSEVLKGETHGAA
jgi:SAM-dependent methyltransferase